jgi:hypothetical protein
MVAGEIHETNVQKNDTNSDNYIAETIFWVKFDHLPSKAFGFHCEAHSSGFIIYVL